jgi:D-3-phosphoglycerate dehydrogenase
LAERLGRLYSSLVGGTPGSFDVCVEGDIAAYDTRILALAVLKGYFSRISDDPVSYVNAPGMATAAGLELREITSSVSDEYVNLLSLRDGTHSISGTLTGRSGQQRLVEIDGHGVDVPPADHMLLISNDDRPGVIGAVGTILGDAAVNIADMDVGRVERPGSAVMLIATGSEVDPAILDALRAAPGVSSVIALEG